MVSALNRKLLRDLSNMKGQVLTIALVVACGVASYVTMRSTWSSLAESKESYFERYRFADLFVTLKRAPNAVVANVEAIPGVAIVYSRVVRMVTIPMPTLTEVARGYLVSLPDEGRPPLNDIYLRSGRFPDASRDDEVVIVESFARAHGLQPGDSIPIILNGKLRQVQIVGIGLSPEYVFLGGVGDFVPDDKQIAAVWMLRSAMAPTFRMEGAFNDLAIQLQPGVDRRPIMRKLDALLEPYGGLGTVGQEKQISSYLLDGELAQLEQMATVVPGIFLAVAAFLLNVVLSRLIFLQRLQVAALKALGYATSQVMWHYLQQAFVIVTLGSVLGLVLGSYLGGEMIKLYARYFRFPTLLFEVTPDVVATAIGVSAAAAIIGAIVSVRQITTMSPAEAMQPPMPARYRRGLLERLGIEWILGVSAMMVVRELRRRPWRLALSSLGIAAAVGIVVVGRFGSDSMSRMVDVIFNQEQRGDVTVGLLEPQPKGIEHEFELMPGVLDVEGLRIVPIRVRAAQRWRDTAIIGIPANTRLRGLIDRYGAAFALPESGLAMSQKLAEILQVRVGDLVELELREGDRRHLAVRVDSLIDDAFGLQIYMEMQELHARLGQQPSLSVVQLRVDPLEFDDLRQRLKEMPTVSQVTIKSAVIDRFRSQSQRTMQVMTLVLSAFGAVIAVGVVYNNARVALSVRSRDLSSLRVLGFSQREISTILLSELAVQMIIGIPLGLVLGKYWSGAIMATNDPETYRFATFVSGQTYAYATVVAVAAAIFSALLVRRTLAKQDLIAVLKTRE